MKKLLPFMFAAVLFFSASTLFAMDPSGCIDGGCTPQEQVTPLTSDYCASFPFGEFNFLLQIDESGHGHTLGDWCTDWNPTGTVNVIPLGNLKLVIFDMVGRASAPNCSTTIEISGALIALGNNITLGGRITWAYDGAAPFEYKGKAVCF